MTRFAKAIRKQLVTVLLGKTGLIDEARRYQAEARLRYFRTIGRVEDVFFSATAELFNWSGDPERIKVGQHSVITAIC